MWTDEFFTFYASSLPTLQDIWGASLTGGDITPPLFFIITRASMKLFGVNMVALRLPAILGFWVMCLCLYRFVERRSGALYGFVALLFPIATGAYPFAYDGRSYGFVLGCAGVALLSWQSLGTHRRLALFGLWLSLTLAISTHYYAVFILLAFAIGEAARILHVNRIDIKVWLVFILSLIPLLISWPMIRAARSFSTGFWAPPHAASIPLAYAYLIGGAVVPMIPAFVLLALYLKGRRATQPAHEIALAVGFTLIPCAIFIVALSTNAYAERYTLPAILGFDILLAFMLSRLNRMIALVVIFSLCLWFPFIQKRQINVYRTQAQTRNVIIEGLRSVSDVPIVSFSVHTFLPLSYYAPEGIRERVVYLADPVERLHYFGTDTEDRLMLGLGREWFGWKVETWHDFLATHQRFLAHGPINHTGWLLRQTGGRRVSAFIQHGEEVIYMVD